MNPARPVPQSIRRTVLATALALVAALVIAAAASASNKTIGATLRTWSNTLGIDAHSVTLAATNQHPRRMIFSARRFRADALKARTAVRAQRASNATGVRAKTLAIAAFTDYALAGRQWVLSGQARLAGHKALAATYASRAAVRARAGNRLLVRAGRLVP